MPITKYLLILVVSAGVVLAGCGDGNDNIIQDQGPDVLYELGLESMEIGNFPTALAYFQALEARYPFSNVTRQAQLEMIYAYYRNREPPAALHHLQTLVWSPPYELESTLHGKTELTTSKK